MIKKQTLTYIGFWMACCPAFMLTMLPSCYFCDTGRVKSMSLTEVVDAMHHVLYAVGVSEDKSLSTPLIRSEEHTSELQSHSDLVCRLLLEKKKKNNHYHMLDYTCLCKQ